MKIKYLLVLLLIQFPTFSENITNNIYLTISPIGWNNQNEANDETRSLKKILTNINNIENHILKLDSLFGYKHIVNEFSVTENNLEIDMSNYNNIIFIIIPQKVNIEFKGIEKIKFTYSNNNKLFAVMNGNLERLGPDWGDVFPLGIWDNDYSFIAEYHNIDSKSLIRNKKYILGEEIGFIYNNRNDITINYSTLHLPKDKRNTLLIVVTTNNNT